MEEDSEGHCESDVSDGWSIVDYNTDFASVVGTSSDSGLSGGKNGSSFGSSDEKLDECFELTEMTLSSVGSFKSLPPSVQDAPELHMALPCINPPVGHESDGDTDGISVISEDEEYVTWKQAAHDNYRNTMRLLETPPSLNISPFNFDERDVTLTEELKEPEESVMEAEAPVEVTKNEVSVEVTTNEAPIEVTPVEVPVEITTNEEPMDVTAVEPPGEAIADEVPVTSAEISEDPEYSDVVPYAEEEEEFLEEYYQPNMPQIVSKNFITYAVIVAMACIAIGHFLRTGNGKEDVMEMLDELRSENEVLKNKVHDLSKAYATLEAKILSTGLPIKTAAVPDIQSKFQNARATDMLSQLIAFNAGSDPIIDDVTNKLQKHFVQIETLGMITDFTVLEQKIVHCISKIMKTDNKGMVFRLVDLEKRLNQRLNRLKKNNDVLNIIQWYPDEMGSRDDISETVPQPNSIPVRDEKLSEPRISDSKTLNGLPPSNRVPVSENDLPPESYSEPQNAHNPKTVVAEEVSSTNQKLPNPSDSPISSSPVRESISKPTIPISESDNSYSIPNSDIVSEVPHRTRKDKKLKEKKLRVTDKYTVKKGKRESKENIQKSKVFPKDRVNCDQTKNKTGAWFINRGKGREELRKIESSSDWQFSRGRKDLKKDDATWYFKKFNLNSRNAWRV